MAQREVERYTTLLSLTAQQADAALTIFTDEATSESSLRANERTAHKTLESAVVGGDTATIQQTAATLGQLSGELTALRALALAKFYATLSTDQKSKFSELQEEHLLGGGPGGPGLGLRH
jgi:Spy/CpxP family protein refolding chaperone